MAARSTSSNRGGSVFLHVRHQVALDIHRNSDARMAQPFLHDLGVDIRASM